MKIGNDSQNILMFSNLGKSNILDDRGEVESYDISDEVSDITESRYSVCLIDIEDVSHIPNAKKIVEMLDSISIIVSANINLIDDIGSDFLVDLEDYFYYPEDINSERYEKMVENRLQKFTQTNDSRKLTELQSEIVENMPDGALLIDSDLDVLYKNRIFSQFSFDRIGLERSKFDNIEDLVEFIEMSESIIVDDKRPLSKIIEDVFKTGRVETFEIEYDLTSLNRVHQCRFSTLDEDCLLAVFRDVTKNKRYEKQLNEIINLLPSALYVKDSDGRYTLTNETIVEQFGLNRDEIIGMTDQEIAEKSEADIDGMEKIRKNDEMVLNSGTAHYFPNEELRINGEVRVFQTRKIPYKPLDSDETHILGVSRDVTEMERNRIQLEKQNEQLEELLEFMSHDLRNPLSIAEGYVEQINSNPESSQEYVGYIEDAHKRMERMIDNTLEWLRYGHTNIGASVETSLEKIARESWERMDTKNADIEIEGDMEFNVSEKAMSHLFEKAFENSIKHVSDDVNIKVGVLEDNDGFYIEDDGPGIPEEMRGSVMKRGKTYSGSDTGFGISMMNQISSSNGFEMTIPETDCGRFEFHKSPFEFSHSQTVLKE